MTTQNTPVNDGYRPDFQTKLKAQTMNAEPRMDQWILVIDLDDKSVTAIRPTEKQLQQLEDTEDFVILNPLTNQVYVNGGWQAIPTGSVTEFNSIVRIA